MYTSCPHLLFTSPPHSPSPTPLDTHTSQTPTSPPFPGAAWVHTAAQVHDGDKFWDLEWTFPVAHIHNK